MHRCKSTPYISIIIISPNWLFRVEMTGMFKISYLFVLIKELVHCFLCTEAQKSTLVTIINTGSYKY